MPGRRVDGNDVLAVYRVVRDAVEHARAGQGPTLVEAVTYRMDAHTNADDASRYRTSAEVDAWRKRDPITRLERHLRAVGVLDDAGVAEIAAEAEDFAARLRERMNTDPVLDPMEMFRHVYAEPTPQLREQAALLAAELAVEAEAPVGGVEARA